MSDKMNILQIAKECNGDLTMFGGEPLWYTFEISNLEKFTQAVIESYVSEQKVAGYIINDPDDRSFVFFDECVLSVDEAIKIDNVTPVYEKMS